MATGVRWVKRKKNPAEKLSTVGKKTRRGMFHHFSDPLLFLLLRLGFQLCCVTELPCCFNYRAIFFLSVASSSAVPGPNRARSSDPGDLSAGKLPFKFPANLSSNPSFANGLLPLHLSGISA